MWFAGRWNWCPRGSDHETRKERTEQFVEQPIKVYHATRSQSSPPRTSDNPHDELSLTRSRHSSSTKPSHDIEPILPISTASTQISYRQNSGQVVRQSSKDSNGTSKPPLLYSERGFEISVQHSKKMRRITVRDRLGTTWRNSKRCRRSSRLRWPIWRVSFSRRSKREL